MVTVELRDVTKDVVGGIAEGVTGQARYDAIEKRQKELIAACESDAGHRCRVAAFFGGLEYKLIKQLEIRDVRLVYAPTDAVGNFGGDVTTGCGRGRPETIRPIAPTWVGWQPADPSRRTSYHPQHFLRVSTRGLQEGLRDGGGAGGTSAIER